ncbi:MAG: hypothetical protein AAGL98_07550, partial [Planctomycetota bacterium]
MGTTPTAGQMFPGSTNSAKNWRTAMTPARPTITSARRYGRLIIPLFAIALMTLASAPDVNAKGFKKSFRGHRGSSFRTSGFNRGFNRFSNRRFGRSFGNRGFNRGFRGGFGNRRFINQRFSNNNSQRFNTSNRFRFQNQYFNTNRRFVRDVNDFDRFDEFAPATFGNDRNDVFTVRSDDAQGPARGIDRGVDLSVNRNTLTRRRANLTPSTAEAAYQVPTASQDQAWALLEAGQYAQAQFTFGRLATANRDDASLKIGFGLASASLGQTDRADNAFGRAHKLDPQIWNHLTDRPIAKAIATDLLAGDTPLSPASKTQLQKLTAESAEDAYEPNEEAAPASP